MDQPRHSRLSPDASGRFQLPSKDQPPPQPTRSQRGIEIFLFVVFGIALVLGGFAVWSSFSPEYRSVPSHVDDGLKNDRLNILVIGIGGDAHPGGGKDLADAVLLASLKPSTGEAAVISLPRDLWTKVGRYGTHRLNQAHALGERNGYPGGGPGLTADTVSQLLGQPVHAFVRVDFAAFEKVINSLGGIDVECTEPFYDYLFRDGFPRGVHHLDGKRALAYARYRYILGPQGDNFARELRQQQVIDAVRAKVRSRNPQDVARLLGAMSGLSQHTQTNLTTTQMVSLYRQFGSIDQRRIRHVSLKPLTEVFRVTRVADAGEAVRPRGNDYSALQRAARDVFTPQQRAGLSISH
jgi:LCP family protein required for cell wall assembly